MSPQPRIAQGVHRVSIRILEIYTSKGTRSVEPKISVIIPVKNEARHIASCLQAIRGQTLKPFEVIVVDGHSMDGTVAIAKTFGTRVFFEEYRTRAGACQVGLQETQGDLVAFTDADCLPDPRWLETLARDFADDCAGVGGRIENEGDTFWQRCVDIALNTLVGSANSVQGKTFAEQRYVSSISGCNSMYRRKDLIEIGGFNTELVTSEDTELNRRMLRRGKLLYVPDAIVHHRHQRGLRDFAHRMFQYGYGRGQTLLMGPPLLMPLLAVGLLVLAVLQPWYAVALLGGYLAILLVSSVGAAVRKRQLKLLAAVPVIYLIEHVCYAAGFWTGIFRTRLPRRSRVSWPEENTP